jgi:hypothetical protein
MKAKNLRNKFFLADLTVPTNWTAVAQEPFVRCKGK